MAVFGEANEFNQGMVAAATTLHAKAVGEYNPARAMVTNVAP